MDPPQCKRAIREAAPDRRRDSYAHEARIAIAVITGDEVESEHHSSARAEQGQAGATGCDYTGGAGPLESPLPWRAGLVASALCCSTPRVKQSFWEHRRGPADMDGGTRSAGGPLLLFAVGLGILAMLSIRGLQH